MEALGGEEVGYSSCSMLTSELDGGEWSVSRPFRALPPGKVPPYPLDRRLGGLGPSVCSKRENFYVIIMLLAFNVD
jgi:hypothetical protein